MQVEDAFMGGAAVAAHQVFSCSQAVLARDLCQLLVAALLGGIEDDADVHHDINEEAVLRQEGAQVCAFLAEAQSHRLAGGNQNFIEGGVARDVQPALVG